MAHAKKIILVALEEELPKSTLPGFHIEYTGVGKINASLKTAEVIQKFSPELIINYGPRGDLRKIYMVWSKSRIFCNETWMPERSVFHWAKPLLILF